MINSYYKKILLNPFFARIAYDGLIAIIIPLIVISLFQLFRIPTISFFEIIVFPLYLIASNYLLGIYGRYKMSSDVLKKSFLILCSGFFTIGAFYLIGHFSLSVLLSTIFIVILTILPRFFFNFYNINDRNKLFNSIVSDKYPILVVGGGGYIGSVLVEKLLKDNYSVRVFDKFYYGKLVLKDLKKNKKLEIVEGDISNIYELTLALKNVQCVVHLAGIVGDPAASIDEKLTRHMNIISTRILKETVKAFHIPKFIFTSSCSVYGVTDKILDENSPVHPISLYAKTKIDSENELLYDPVDDFHPVILRLATVFGHSRKPRFDLVANLFAAQGYNKGKLTVTNGQQWRPFIHVTDVAEAIIKIIKAPEEKVSRQIFNVGDDSQHLQIGQLAKLVAKTMPKQKKVKILARNVSSDKRDYRVSFKKIKDVLNFTSSVSIEDGLREIYRNFKKGKYKKPYTDDYYSNLEMTKIIKKEFYSDKYRKTHVTEIS